MLFYQCVIQNTFSSESSSSSSFSSSPVSASSAGASVVVVVVGAPGLVLPRLPILGPGLKGLIPGPPMRGLGLAVVAAAGAEVSSLCDSSSAAVVAAVVVLLPPLKLNPGLCLKPGLEIGALVLALVSPASSDGAAVVLPRVLLLKRLPPSG